MLDQILATATKAAIDFAKSPHGMHMGNKLLNKGIDAFFNGRRDKCASVAAQSHRCPRCGAKKQFGRYCSSCGTNLAACS